MQKSRKHVFGEADFRFAALHLLSMLGRLESRDCSTVSQTARSKSPIQICTGWNRYIHGSIAGLPILRGRCKVVPYAGVSLVPARGSPKRRYVQSQFRRQNVDTIVAKINRSVNITPIPFEMSAYFGEFFF